MKIIPPNSLPHVQVAVQLIGMIWELKFIQNISGSFQINLIGYDIGYDTINYWKLLQCGFFLFFFLKDILPALEIQ